MYDTLLEWSRTEFEPVRTLRRTERGSVELLRHRASGRAYIFRCFTGSAEVYRALLHVDCPRLPRIYEAAERDGRAAVLEEYVQGDTLSELLRGALFSPRETRAVVTELCEGLWVLHGQGAVHRDVKPSNVILRSSGAVLIDFDASRVVKETRRSDTQILGTAGFAAPEQYGFSQTDRRADIYSLGVLMNVMLTGEHPSRRLARGRLGRVIQRCTMVNPEKRYPDVMHLMEALS